MLDFFNKLKLKTKIIVSVVFLMVTAFTILVPLIANKARNQAKLDAFQTAEEKAFRYGNEIKNRLEAPLLIVRGISYSLARFESIRPENRRKVFSSVLETALKENQNILATWTIWEPNTLDGLDEKNKGKAFSSESGRFSVAWQNANGKYIIIKISDKDSESGGFYQDPKKLRREIITEPYFFTYTGKKEDNILMISIAQPIIVKGKFLGVVGVDISLEQIQKMVKNIKPYKTGYGVLVSSTGIQASHPSQKEISKKFGHDIPNQQEKILNKIKTGKKISLNKKSVVTKKNFQFIFTPIPIGKTQSFWSLGVAIPMEKVLESGVAISNDIIQSSLFIVLTILAVVILLLILLAKSLADPLSKSNAKLSDASSSIKSAATQVSTSSQNLSSGASELASSVEEMTASMEELQSIIEANTKTANKGAMLSKESSRATSSTGTKMEKLKFSLNDIHEHSQKIVKINKVIDDIAFQTNILALNAAVEAARAGDAGRGFVVVSEQVKTLAGKSAEAAKETAELIEKAVMSVQEGQKLGEEVFSASTEVTNMNKQVEALLQELNQASQEQLKGANQVSEGISQINHVVQQTASSSEELAASGEELLDKAHIMTEIVNNLSQFINGQTNQSTNESSNERGTERKNLEKSTRQNSPSKKSVKKTELIKPEDKIPMDDFEGF